MVVVLVLVALVVAAVIVDQVDQPSGRAAVRPAASPTATASPTPTPTPRAKPYSPTGAYAWGGIVPPNENTTYRSPDIVPDRATGLPKVRYPDGLYWNPVTIALWGLQEFDRHKLYGRRASLREARRAADWLVAHQRPGGEWLLRMRFAYPRLGTLAPGWAAAQAQGNAISLLVRVFAATRHAAYLSAARRARLAFERPIWRHGVRRSWMGHVFFEGFPTKKPSLTLEDFQLALLGLYDLSRYDGVAKVLFRQGLATLRWALPHYQGADGRPQWDLADRTAGATPLYEPSAHEFNARLLGLFGRLSRQATLKRYAARWKASQQSA